MTPTDTNAHSADHPDTPRPQYTFTALLARWTALAQASVALPKTAEGDRWRAAVPAIIGLQALTCTLADAPSFDDLPPDQRALGIDRAAVGIRTHASTLHALWRSEPLHPELLALIDDARAALHAAQHAATRVHAPTSATPASPAPFTMPDWADLPARLAAAAVRDAWLLGPGIQVAPGVPVAVLAGPAGSPPPPAALTLLTQALGLTSTPTPAATTRGPILQVYRQASPPADRPCPLEEDLPAGTPLLWPAVQAGQPQPPPMPMLCPRGAPPPLAGTQPAS
ncbi:MAG: hypothetical protein LW650_02900 [Planctomycetaceae bacterium]|jgi:hypothetical protein|nr:hypothetical protein [Phycisphaerales bacterium]MCE2652467.1 hypothetical protein [Planctomycetaceae bacterium]